MSTIRRVNRRKEQEQILSRLQLPREERQKLIQQENNPNLKQKEEPKHPGLSKTQYKKYLHSRTKLDTRNASNLFQNFLTFKKHKFEAFGTVNHICAHPTMENQWMYTCGQAAQIHCVDELKKKVKIYKMPKAAQSASAAVFRNDGAIFVVGGGGAASNVSGKQGVVAVYRNMDSARATIPLRTFASHKHAVSSVHFPDETHILSSSTDVHYHLLAQTHSDKPLLILKHDDYTTSISSISDSLVVTGCADHYVRVWDLRQPNKSVRSWKMGAAVRDVGVVNGGKVVGAGDGIFVWDIGYEENIWGGDEVNCISCRGNLIIAGSLDGSIRVWDASNADLKYEKTFEKPVLAVDLSIDHKRMFVSTSDKLLLKSVREDNLVSKKEEEEEKITIENFKTLVSPLVIRDELNRETRSASLDKFASHLGAFRYKDALNVAVTKYINEPEIAVALITELMSRNELLNALDARDENSLLPVLRFLAEHVTDVRFYRILVTLAEHTIAIYGETIGLSSECDKWWKILNARVQEEIESLRSAAKIRGVLDMLIRSSQCNSQ
jgi:U3 small nucleolar RNA-associated protein 15